MRIVGGRFKGRQLAAPRDATVRPTTDRVREALFNALVHRKPNPVAGARVLDAFAGTGALGLEALSRGAEAVLFMETSAVARALVRRNIEALDLTGCARLFRRDATRPGPIGTMAPFDLVFVDPPYGQGLGERAAAALAAGGWLKPAALLVLEEAAGGGPVTIPGFALDDERRYGDTVIRVFEISGGPDSRPRETP